MVIHVSQGYEEREKHIRRMLSEIDIPFEFILSGDIKDITPEIDRRWFKGCTSMTPAQKSCALKHIHACEKIVAGDLPGALILEDDICLSRNFPEIYNRSMEELQWCCHHLTHPRNPAQSDNSFIINYEDTRLRFIPRSRRQKGRVLYPGDRDRMTGCLYVNNEAAKTVLEYYGKTDADVLPIDHFHSRLLRQKLIQYLWCQPTVATQGSHNGMFSSAINFHKSIFSALIWKIKKQYRRLLYFLR